MKTIVLIGQKGGVGKTTLTTALAVAATLAGFETVIIDTDPQLSATNWKARRGADRGPLVVKSDAATLPALLETCRQNGAEYVFIDTPGKLADRPGQLAPEAVAAAQAADLVLIPVRQQIFEVETLAPARALIEAAGGPAAAVIVNGAHPSTKNPADDMRQLVAGLFNLPVASAFICHRSAYANAPSSGQGPQEIDPEGKAAAEIAALFEYVHKSTTPQTHATNERTARHG
ncbi:AAA family ATPase [Sinorhizobium meliloti]|uniref:nucleotide-binding protein n=1 Tax=Rhizobium meliloti TaxID=382 RepID=UPI001296CF24|nr:AAA family ATPase [Sinorhizobium meliloti]MQW45315.1 AAA family ATPase [Sinorhizobium meliloti]